MMGMRNTFKVLFYIKKTAPLRNGNVPIMGRITINGQCTQFATQLSVQPELWNVSFSCVMGRSALATRINEQLTRIRLRIELCYNRLSFEHGAITPVMVKEAYRGLNFDQEMVVAFFKRHNEEFEQMIGISRSKSTLYKYQCVCRHLESYIMHRYGCRDLPFRKLDEKFVPGFHAFILQEQCRKNNTGWVYMIALKHILSLARSRGYMAKDLFAGYRLKSESVFRNYLTIEELNRLIRFQPRNRTMQIVRDAFLFSCLTGLSYIDICGLTADNVLKETNRTWIRTKRRKTGAMVLIRLFALPEAILTRYATVSARIQIFELPTNCWCNKCLNKIMSLAGIDKRVSFHQRRHTFATTITLSQGAAMETISRLLGHTNIRTTQIYATVTRPRLDSEMEHLSKRIDTLCSDKAWLSTQHSGTKKCRNSL